MMTETTGAAQGVSVAVLDGDIADVASLAAEAYVNAANNELWMGAGVAGALKRAAGEGVEREAVAQGPIAVGEAVVTSAGEMPAPARIIIHAAAMGFTDRTQIYASRDTVYAATVAALARCVEQQVQSVAIPALGTGVGGLDIEVAADAMAQAIADHIAGGTTLTRILIVTRPMNFIDVNDSRTAVFGHAFTKHGLRNA